MHQHPFPDKIPNWISGKEAVSLDDSWLEKANPDTGLRLCSYARSRSADVQCAIEAARNAQPAWADIPPVLRGSILFKACQLLEDRQQDIATTVALETGKSRKDALGETGGAIALGRFYAGEGQRLYARTTTSGAVGKSAMTIRQPAGIAGLIIAANTPIANIAWKVFPALICGNGVVLKTAEDTPATAWIFTRILHEAGLPAGVLNVLHGLGEEAGAPLVQHPDINVISFTGSTRVGRQIAAEATTRLCKVSLELGGKNPLVVCDDANLDNAVKWAALSAFSNAGQRCAAASRIIVFDSVYDRFLALLLEKTLSLKIGPGDGDDLGPVINARQLANMLKAVDVARRDGARIVIGGNRLTDPAHANGFYMAPTLITDVSPDAAISQNELFGPIACIYKVPDYSSALALANHSHYGLTASIHTRNVHRMMDFVQRVQAGVATVNLGTHGSEPHMPFGGVKHSGNGTREPGTEALDIYSELKDVYIGFDSGRCA